MKYKNATPSVFEGRVFIFYISPLIFYLHITITMFNTFEELWNIFFF